MCELEVSTRNCQESKAPGGMMRCIAALLAIMPVDALLAAPTTRCDTLLRGLFVDNKGGFVSPKAVAAACSPEVEWNDMSTAAATRILQLRVAALDFMARTLHFARAL